MKAVKHQFNKPLEGNYSYTLISNEDYWKNHSITQKLVGTGLCPSSLIQTPVQLPAEVALFYLVKLSLGFGLNTHTLKLETESLASKIAVYTTLSMKRGWI